MKICIAQIRPEKGNIQKNIEIHRKWIAYAVQENADFICFPELSLTGYEPKMAKRLASGKNDARLDVFQQISNESHIGIALGLPIKKESKIYIGMLIFRPKSPRETYLKQNLHADEMPYFAAGNHQLLVTLKNTIIAPAICYESLQHEHAENCKKLGAQIYVASVAKSEQGIKKAYAHFTKTASKHSMSILMSNCVGECDDFSSVGQSAIWDAQGVLKQRLGNNNEGVLIFDIQSSIVIKKEENFNT